MTIQTDVVLTALNFEVAIVSFVKNSEACLGLDEERCKPDNCFGLRIKTSAVGPTTMKMAILAEDGCRPLTYALSTRNESMIAGQCIKEISTATFTMEKLTMSPVIETLS